MAKLILSRELAEKIFSDVKQKAPNEACGVLGGKIEEDGSIVIIVYICRNVSNKPRMNYSISPEDLANVFTDIESRNIEIIGFYHSHPFGSVTPSEADKDKVTWHNEFYVIVNLKREISAWVWDKNQGDFKKKEVLIT